MLYLAQHPTFDAKAGWLAVWGMCQREACCAKPYPGLTIFSVGGGLAAAAAWRDTTNLEICLLTYGRASVRGQWWDDAELSWKLGRTGDAFCYYQLAIVFSLKHSRAGPLLCHHTHRLAFSDRIFVYLVTQRGSSSSISCYLTCFAVKLAGLLPHGCENKTMRRKINAVK